MKKFLISDYDRIFFIDDCKIQHRFDKKIQS